MIFSTSHAARSLGSRLETQTEAAVFARPRARVRWDRAAILGGLLAFWGAVALLAAYLL